MTVLVTERFPYGVGETFLQDEIDELRRTVGEVIVYPIWPHPPSARQERLAATHPSSRVRPSPRALAAILVRAFRLPLLALRLIVDGLRRREVRILAVELIGILRGVRFALVAGGLPIEHVHAYWLSYPASCARTIAHLLDIPWSATGHRYDLVQGLDLAGKARDARALRFVSATSERLFRERVGRTPVPVQVVPLGQRIPEVPVAPVPAGPMVVCIPANLLPVKGHETGLRALRILLDLGHEGCLLIAGDGPRHAELERLVEELGLSEHVSMPGRVDRDRLLDLYRDGLVTAVVLPSLDLGSGVHEGLPIALVEAMALGVPVVASESGGIPELVGPHNGMLVPQRDPHALASALVTLHRDLDLRASLVTEAHRTVRQRFDRTSVVPSLVGLMTGTHEEVRV